MKITELPFTERIARLFRRQNTGGRQGTGAAKSRTSAIPPPLGDPHGTWHDD